MSTSEAKFQRWFELGLKQLSFVPEDDRKQMARVFAKKAIAKKPDNAEALAKEIFNYDLAEGILDEINFCLRETKIFVIGKKTSVFFRGKTLSGYVAIKRALYSLYRDLFYDLPYDERWHFAKKYCDFVFLWVNVQKTFQEGIRLGPHIEHAIADRGESKVTDVDSFFQFFLKASPKVGAIHTDGRLLQSDISNILEDYAQFIKEMANTSAKKEPTSSQESEKLREKIAAEPKSRKRSDKSGIKSFPLPEGVQLSEIYLSFISDDTIKVKIRTQSIKLNYAEIGFRDVRKGSLWDSRWEVLRDDFAQNNGIVSLNTQNTKYDVKMAVYTINKRLKEFFRTDKKLLFYDGKAKAYRTKFKISYNVGGKTDSDEHKESNSPLSTSEVEQRRDIKLLLGLPMDAKIKELQSIYGLDETAVRDLKKKSEEQINASLKEGKLF